MLKRWVFFSLICLPIVCSASDTGTLAGVVTDPAGAVVKDEAILLVCRGTDQRERHLYTDANGQYSIDLPAGSCDVFFSHGTFEPVAKSVQIDTGKKVVVNVKLRFRKGIKFVE